MKKRILAAMLAAAMVVTAFSGCSSKSKDEDSSETQTDVGDASDSGDVSNDEEIGEITATELNIAIQPSGAFIPLLIAREEGWLEEDLAEYGVTVNWNSFEAGPQINDSMAEGSTDVGPLGDVPAVSAIAAGQDNVVACIAAEGPTAYALLVAQDSEIESVEDLKGKTIATVVGSTGHNLVDKVLASVDLSIDDDVNFLSISASEASDVLISKEADAVAIWEPNVTRLTENGTARVLAYGQEVGLLGVNPLMINREFAEANPGIVQILVKDYQRGVDAVNDLSGTTLTNIAEYLSLEENQVLTVASNWDYTVDITDDDIVCLNDTIVFLVKIGILTKSYDISDYIYER